MADVILRLVDLAALERLRSMSVDQLVLTLSLIHI